MMILRTSLDVARMPIKHIDLVQRVKLYLEACTGFVIVLFQHIRD